jgi:hypothetical protein
MPSSTNMERRRHECLPQSCPSSGCLGSLQRRRRPRKTLRRRQRRCAVIDAEEKTLAEIDAERTDCALTAYVSLARLAIESIKLGTTFPKTILRGACVFSFHQRTCGAGVSEFVRLACTSAQASKGRRGRGVRTRACAGE